MDNNEKFSDDPQENFRIENEILKIKLKAQYGDAFFMQSNESMPPEMENQFLKNIIAFEDAHANAELTTVYESIGRPAYKPAEELDTAGNATRSGRSRGSRDAASWVLGPGESGGCGVVRRLEFVALVPGPWRWLRWLLIPRHPRPARESLSELERALSLLRHRATRRHATTTWHCPFLAQCF